MKSPFAEARPILQQLHQAGYEAYFVGGAVRDYLLNREIGDVDIATSAKPLDVQRIFDRTVDVGVEHGTIIVLYEQEQYEVTTYRAESEYKDFRRPKSVTYITSLKGDLKRRDFTINAMAMDLNGQILDYFNGEEDLTKQMIRTVGTASERFSEDALRMLRAVRFVSQLSFSLCPNTFAAIVQHAELLANISVERKTIELEKLLKGSNVQEALKLIVRSKIHVYLPGLEQKCLQLLQLSTYSFEILSTREEIWSLLVYIVNPTSIEDFLRMWKLPVKIIKSVEKRIHYLFILNEKKWLDDLLYEAGEETALSVEKIRSVLKRDTKIEDHLSEIRERLITLPIKSRSELAVSGRDVMKIINRKPGPWVSHVLASIEKEIILHSLENNSTAIKEWLLRCKQDFEQNY